jgi:hypothetical protein
MCDEGGLNRGSSCMIETVAKLYHEQSSISHLPVDQVCYPWPMLSVLSEL